MSSPLNLCPVLFLRGALLLRKIAGELGQVEYREDQYQFRGSEAAVRRLTEEYKETPTASAVFESGTGMHVFILRTRFFTAPYFLLRAGEESVA